MNRPQKGLVAVLVLLVAIGGVAAAAVMFTPTTGEIALNSNSGPTVVVGGGPSIDFGSAFASDTKIDVTTKAGNATVSSSSATAITIDKSNLTGTTSYGSEVDASAGNLTVDPADKPSITVKGDLKTIEWRDPTVDDKTPDFNYSGASGTNTITVRGVPSSTQLSAADVSTSSLQDVATSNANGNVTFSGLPNSKHKIQIQTSSGGPTLSNGRTNRNLSAEPTDLKVDVNDSDMPFDSVDVEFKVDGNKLGTKTVGSNGTATLDVSGQSFVGGNHTVDVTATDGYGATDSLSYEFRVPAELQIRNETRPSELVDNASAELTFYYESGGVQVSANRTAHNGTINMTGLPVAKPIVAVAEADGYRTRRIFIDSIYDQERIYMLSKNKQFTRTEFKLQDYTGKFPQDTTVLKVQRTFNGSYQTVIGDYFGASGSFPAELQYNKRHRLILLNTESGARRELGTFTPLSSGETTLALSVSGQVSPISSDATLSTAPSTGLLPAGNVTLSVNLRDAGENITSYNVTFIKRVNGSNTTLKTVNRSSSGLIRETVNLSGAEGGKAIVISKYRTASGVQKQRTKEFGIIQRNSPPPVLGELTALRNLLPKEDRDPFTTAVALLVTLLGTAGIASSARLAPETIGAVAVGWLTVFGILGWIGFDLLFVGLVVFGSFSILRRGV